MSVFEYMAEAWENHGEQQMEQKTLAIIKPDAVRMGGEVVGRILVRAAAGGLHPVAMWMGELPRSTWETLYEEHRERSFFEELVAFMCSGPSVYVVLEGEEAITTWRAIMGATDPLKAQPGSIRRMFGRGGPANAVHGSDSPEAFEREHALVFALPN